MENLNAEVFEAFQNKLKVGNRRGVHLNAIPGNSRYKFDVARFATIFKSLPERFILDLLTQSNMSFKFSIHDTPSTETANAVTKSDIYLNDYDDDKKAVPEKSAKAKSEEELERELILQKLVSSIENLIFQNEVIQSEKGVNTLGFGFPTLIRKDMGDGQISASPILIWSLKIKPTNQMNTWEISRTEDDPIYINEVLINHLQNDSGVTVNPIPEEMLSDGKIDKKELYEICATLLQQLKVTQDLDFILNNYAEIPPLKTKATYDTFLAKKGDAIIEKSGIFSLFEVQKQNIINDYQLLKTDFKPLENNSLLANFQSVTAISTDPSQQSILESIKLQSKILIQGPPGTGKSQTLTALLINALENKHKTIIVCEKQTALEVLYNALEKKGLSKYAIMIKDGVGDRRFVVDAVRNTIDSADFKKQLDAFPESVLKEQLDAIENIKSKLNSVHQKLNLELLDNNDWTDIVGAIFEYQSGNEAVDLNAFLFKFSQEEFSEIVYLFKSGEFLFQKFKPYQNSYFFNPKKLIEKDPFLTYQTIGVDFKNYKGNWNEIQSKIQEFEPFYYSKRKEEFVSQLDEVKAIIDETEVITTSIPPESDIFNTEKTSGFVYKFLALFSSSKKKVRQTQKRLETLAQNLKKISLHANFLPINLSRELWNTKNEMIAYREKVEQAKTDFHSKVENDYKNLDFLNFFDKNVSNIDSDKIANHTKSLKQQIQNDNWLQNTDFGLTFTDFQQKLQNSFSTFDSYTTNPDNPFQIEYDWFSFYNPLSDFQKNCLTVLYPITNWKPNFLYGYFNLLLKANTSETLTINEGLYADFDKKIKSFSFSQINFIENYWNISQKNAVKNFEQTNKDLTVANLYNKRKSVNFNRLTLRQIVMKDTDLFTSFFPIILTTPDTCCNLFQGKNFYFDFVVFDEASQLKLEDNLPAMLKGKNIIIAGDEHQMPPSNYFSTVLDGSIQDEEDMEDDDVITFKNSILNIESLLDYALEYKFDKNHLDFHYRSKHPYLIDFSNHAFYNSRLKPLPSLKAVKPIEFYEVGGVFHEHINEEEAEKVIEILKSIQPKADESFPSVGIATFNITQRNYIKRRIIFYQNEDEAFKEKISALETAGLFIKNLENIQGDERDIIIISTTYGKKKDGKFIQSFGPINHTKGYKLLNVIITRAKEKIYICNSIPVDFYGNYKTALEQEGANNRKAVLYAYLAYCKAVSDGNETARLEILSELNRYGNQQNTDEESSKTKFKQAVFNHLQQKYPDLKISLNYGFGGYNIDVFIERENQKPIALECMSKDLYNSNLAYLEDIHKERILVNSGFEYIRIWSQNCWQNLDFELQKVVKKMA